MKGGRGVSAHTQTDIPMLHLQNNWNHMHGRRHGCQCTNIKQIFVCSTFKIIEILRMEGGMGVSAHTSNIYSNASPLKTLKLSAWRKAWVLAHMHQIDITMLHLQKHWNPQHGRRQGCQCTRIKQTFQCSTFKIIETFCMEGGRGVGAHASNRYSNASLSKTLKPSAWKEA